MAKKTQDKELIKTILSIFSSEEELKEDEEKVKEKELTEMEKLLKYKEEIEAKKKSEEEEEEEDKMSKKELKELEELRKFKAEQEEKEQLNKAKEQLKEFGYSEDAAAVLLEVIDANKIEKLEALKENIFKVENNTVVDPALNNEPQSSDIQKELDELYSKSYKK